VAIKCNGNHDIYFFCKKKKKKKKEKKRHTKKDCLKYHK